MGKRTRVVLVDDLDGTTADEVVEFGIDGQTYSIELSATNAVALRRTLKGWAEHGRLVGAQRRPHLARVDPWRKHVSGQEGVAMRQWCHDNGYHVGNRGPLPFEAVDASGPRTSRARAVPER